jgi:hypothetical protein
MEMMIKDGSLNALFQQYKGEASAPADCSSGACCTCPIPPDARDAAVAQ